MKNKRLPIILITIVLIGALSYSYHRFMITKITSRSTMVTLGNIKSSLEDIIVYYKDVYNNQPISQDQVRNDKLLLTYIKRMRDVSNYVGESADFRGSNLDLLLYDIGNIDDGGITTEDIIYLNDVLVKYEDMLRKINDEQRNSILRRNFCYLTKSNLKEIEAIFVDYPEQ